MATATKTDRDFSARCPFCGDEEATVRIDLNRINHCECSSCGEEFKPADAVARLTDQLSRWEAVARWMDRAAECLGE